MTSVETKDTILATAEQLFASQGFEATSLRAITAGAGVNLAAVHYHFGSKADLAREVLGRRLEPLNRERLRLLDRAEARRTPALLAEIVAAFVVPALNLNRQEGAGEGLKRLMGRIYAEQPEFLEALFRDQFAEVVRRFADALDRSLDHLGRAEVMWRLHFMVGAMAHTLCGGGDLLQNMSGGLCDPRDLDGLTDQLIRFVVGGFQAPVREETR